MPSPARSDRAIARRWDETPGSPVDRSKPARRCYSAKRRSSRGLPLPCGLRSSWSAPVGWIGPCVGCPIRQGDHAARSVDRLSRTEQLYRPFVTWITGKLLQVLFRLLPFGYSNAGLLFMADQQTGFPDLVEARHDFLTEQAQGIHHKGIRNEAAGVEFGQDTVEPDLLTQM